MWKLLGGLAAAAIVIVGFIQISAFDRDPPAAEMQVRTPLDIARIYEGPPADGSQPQGQIVPWDRSELDAWITAKIAELSPLITTDAHRSMAADLSIHSEQRNRGYYLTATYEATQLYNEGVEEDKDAVLFIFLHAAQANDPVAFHNTAYFLEVEGRGSDSIIKALYRSAADLDFQPSFVNLLSIWEDDAGADRDVHQAYLHYALDLDAEGGGWFIVEQVSDFYLYDNPDLPSDGYLDRALVRMRDQFGDVVRYHEDQGYRLSNGIDGPLDETKALQEYLASIAAGGTWAHNRIGFRYMNGLGTTYNKDLARDHLVACLKIDPSDFCAMNLGSLYQTPSRNSIDYPVALAFYQLGANMNGPNKDILEEEIDYVLGEMTPAEKRLGAEYVEAVAQGDYATIPHVKDARPVTP